MDGVDGWMGRKNVMTGRAKAEGRAASESSTRRTCEYDLSAMRREATAKFKVLQYYGKSYL